MSSIAKMIYDLHNIKIQQMRFENSVPCMVYLPGYGHKVTIGSLWNMQGYVHTRL